MSKQESGHGDDVFTLMELYYPKNGRLEEKMMISKSSAKRHGSKQRNSSLQFSLINTTRMGADSPDKRG